MSEKKKTFEEIMNEDDPVYNLYDEPISNFVLDDRDTTSHFPEEDEEGNRFLFNE